MIFKKILEKTTFENDRTVRQFLVNFAKENEVKIYSYKKEEEDFSITFKIDHPTSTIVSLLKEEDFLNISVGRPPKDYVKDYSTFPDIWNDVINFPTLESVCKKLGVGIDTIKRTKKMFESSGIFLKNRGETYKKKIINDIRCLKRSGKNYREIISELNICTTTYYKYEKEV